MINSPTVSSEWSISPPLDTGSNSFTPPNRSVRSCSQPQRRDRRGRVPRLRNSQDDIGAGPPVQFSPVRLLQLQLQRRHSPPHCSRRCNSDPGRRLKADPLARLVSLNVEGPDGGNGGG